jgi:hypothetical protein
MGGMVFRWVVLLGLLALPALSWGKGSANTSATPGEALNHVGQPGRLPLPGLSAGKYPPELMPATPEEWVMRMLDATRNGLAFKHPEAFIEWLDALSEPRFMTALATVALDPDTYPKALGRGIDPSAARNWAEFADPNLYLRWMLAGMDARFYSALLSRMTNPEKLQRWVNFTATPEAYAPMLKALDPATSTRWGQAVGKSANYDPLLQLANPLTSLNWMSAFAEGTAKQLAPDKNGQWLRLPEPFISDQGKSAARPQRY